MNLTAVFQGLFRRRPSARARRILRLPDRRLLAESYLPALAAEGGRILFVGTREYNADDYRVLESRGGQVWTTDIDPKADAWGRPGRHRRGDVCEIDRLFSDMSFDTVICNGVLGFGVDEPALQRRALGAMAAVTRPGGRLLLGWNTDRIDDPLAAGLAEPWFRPEPFAGRPARVPFDTVTHVYDSLVRTEAA